jgi:NRPS condensation-like uncharacterized protein
MRALDPGEAFFYLTDKVSCMNFVVFAEREGALSPTKIRETLNALQSEQGLLRVRIDWDDLDGLRFAEGDDNEIPLMCHWYAADQWMAVIEAQLSAPFPAGASPLARCLYLEADDAEQSVLAMCFHHSIADGRSGVELLRRLLDGIAAPASQPRSANAPALPMYQAFPPQWRWADNPDAADALADEVMADYKRLGRFTPLDWHVVQGIEKERGRRPSFIRRELPVDATSRLLDGCRTESTSAHGAICAAQLMAQHRLTAKPGSTVQFLACPVDMRPQLKPVPSVAQLGLNVSIVSSPFEVKENTTLWSLAREIRAQTRRQLARGEGHLFFSLYGLDAIPIGPSRQSGFTKAVLSSWQNTMVSNVGHIESVVRDTAIKRISFALCPMPYQTLFNAVSTYDGRLVMNIGFDQNRLTAITAEAIVDTMLELLTQPIS